MSRFVSYLLLSLVGCLIPDGLTGQESPAKVRLFILSGQSNMSFDEKQDFALHVQKALPKDRIVAVRHAVGGQGIWHWYKAWGLEPGTKPVPGLPTKFGETYDALLEKVSKVGVDPKSVTSVTLIWMQGETDGRNDAACQVYEKSLRGLIRQFRDDLKRPDMHVVIARINDAQMRRQSWKVVRKAQETVAAGDKFAAWFDTDDLNGDDDNVHNTAEGRKELGRRFAKAAVELIEKK
jgi:hypothetical protein